MYSVVTVCCLLELVFDAGCVGVVCGCGCWGFGVVVGWLGACVCVFGLLPCFRLIGLLVDGCDCV